MNRHEKHAESTSTMAAGEFAVPFGLHMPGHMYQPALAANAKLFADVVELNEDWADFFKRRFQDDLNLPQQLGAGKTPQDVFKVYSDFYRQAFEDYWSESAKMKRELIAKAMRTPHKGSE